MRQLHKPMILGVAALNIFAAVACPDAKAYLYMGGDEVYDALGLNDNYQDQQQQSQPRVNRPQNFNGPSLTTAVRPEAPPQRPVTTQTPSGQRVQWLGYWVGNMQYRVAMVNDALYKVSPDGKATPLPAGTAADTVAVPFDNAFVKGIMNSQPVAGPETQSRMNHQKNGGDARYISNAGLLTPVFMATRTMMVNNEPVIVGGPIISEYRQQPQMLVAAAQPTVVRKTYVQARVNTKSKQTVKRKVVRKRITR